MSKHTPGPWTVDRDGYTAFVDCSAQLVIQPSGEKEFGGYGGVVAECVPEGDEIAIVHFDSVRSRATDKVDEPTYLANARLISSAPDLLAALKSAQGLLALSDVAHLMGQLGETSALHGTLNEIHKAILKAEDSA